MNKTEYKNKIRQIIKVNEKVNRLTEELFVSLNKLLPGDTTLEDIHLYNTGGYHSFSGAFKRESLDEKLSEVLSYTNNGLEEEIIDEIWNRIKEESIAKK